MPVTIVVNKSTAGSPGLSRARDPSLLGDFFEDAVVIMIKTVFAVVGDIEIFPPIVVVIPDTNTLAPSGCHEPCLHRYICECTIVIVVIQVASRTIPGREPLQRGAVHDKDVRPPVVVIIENSDACTSRFNDVFLDARSTENIHHRQPSLFGVVREIGYGSEILCFLRLCRCLCGHQIAQQ